MTLKKWYALMVVTAFAGVISFFHINSYVADKHGVNWLFTVFGIIMSLIAIYCYAKANKIGNPGDPKNR